MKITSVLLTVAVTVILQLALARYTVGGRWVFDVVLVGVVYAALNWGPAGGIVAGTVGGLIQDVLSDDIVGTGGLVKTLVGFTAGFIGEQFVVARPGARVAILAGGSLIHRVLLIALHATLDHHWPVFPWTAILGETAVNSIFGLIAFQLGETMPAFRSRTRQNRRAGLRRREW